MSQGLPVYPLIREGDAADIQGRSGSGVHQLALRPPENQPRHAAQLPSLAQSPKEPGKGLLPLALHDAVRLGVCRKEALSVIGDLRPPEPQGGAGEKRLYVRKKALHHGNIPDITGKPDEIGLSPINIL